MAIGAIKKNIRFKPIIIISLIISSLLLLVAYNTHRLQKDHRDLTRLLKKTRNMAILTKKTFLVEFNRNQVAVKNKQTGAVINTLRTPTLHKVNYSTTLEKNMIVFTGRGTGPYNIRIHGGDLTLKSWLGYKKYIAVNCTGLVTEGRYPKE